MKKILKRKCHLKISIIFKHMEVRRNKFYFKVKQVNTYTLFGCTITCF